MGKKPVMRNRYAGLCLLWLISQSGLMPLAETPRPLPELTIETRIAGKEELLPGVFVFVERRGHETARQVTDQRGRTLVQLNSGEDLVITCRFPGARTERVSYRMKNDSALLSVKMHIYSRVSMISLIANPADWNEKPVVVTGFLEMDSEEAALYQDRGDWQWRRAENALWVQGQPADSFPRRLFDRRRQYVSLWGTFDAKEHGHMGLFAGGIGNIEKIVVLTPR